MQHKKLEATVRAIMLLVLNGENAETGDILRENSGGWDSLKHVELIFMLEDRFNVRFDEDEMSMMNSLTRIVASLEKQLAA
jgi:acyl carrier protein